MGEVWVPQWERVELVGAPVSDDYNYERNIKLCWHTWEGRSWAGAENAFRKYPPHVAANFSDKKVRQYIALDDRAFSLTSSRAEEEFVIQVELAGYAGQTRDMSLEEKLWIAEDVLEPILFFFPYLPDVHPPFYDNQDGILLASVRSPIRWSYEQWVGFSGHVAHQYAPPPDEHWDAGRLDLDTIIPHARRRYNEANTKEKDSMKGDADWIGDTFVEVVRGDDANIWVKWWDDTEQVHKSGSKATDFWQGLPGGNGAPGGPGSFIGDPSVTGRVGTDDKPSRVDVTAPGQDRAMWRTVWYPAKGWTGWFSDGGRMK